MTFVEAIRWRLGRCKNIREANAETIAKSMGVSVAMLGSRLQKEGVCWSRLKDMEMRKRYLQAKNDNPGKPIYKLAPIVGCSYQTLYKHFERWEKMPHRQ